LLFAGEPEALLWPLSRAAASVVLLQVLAQEDARPSARGPSRLEDCESGETEELLIDEAAVSAYREALRRHEQAWAEPSRRSGAQWVRVIAEELGADWSLRSLIAVDLVSPR